MTTIMVAIRHCAYFRSLSDGFPSPVLDDMTLVALEMNLERVELALAALHAEGIIAGLSNP